MERKFNIIEVASELAHRDLVAEVLKESDLWEDPHSDVLSYKEDVQDEFNDLYDEYFDILLNTSEEI
jgi:hypothetical protein